MLQTRAFPIVALAALVPCAVAQISPVTQERSVQTGASVSSGASDSDSDSAGNFGPFVRTVMSSATGAGGASATASASQNSVITPTLVTGTLSSNCAAFTGTTFVTGDSTSQSSYLYIFNLAAPAPIEFTASGGLSYIGRNPEGEPSDLSGRSSVRLLNAATMDLVSGFTLFDTPGTDSAQFTGLLAAGQYVILATTDMHAFSADLLGPPPRSGSGNASASFSLTVVPAPGAAALLGLGVLGRRRRREPAIGIGRCHRPA